MKNTKTWMILFAIIVVVLLSAQLFLQFQTLSLLYNPAVIEIPITTPSYTDPTSFKIKAYTKLIVTRYKIKPQNAHDIVFIAHKYEDPVFPRAEDILSVIGIESSFNPRAKSQLKTDPAVGLMQIRPNIWRHLVNDGRELQHIEHQIRYGALILSSYYQRSKNKESALKAYNVGLTNHMRGSMKSAEQRYIQKYTKERNRFRDAGLTLYPNM